MGVLSTGGNHAAEPDAMRPDVALAQSGVRIQILGTVISTQRREMGSGGFSDLRGNISVFKPEPVLVCVADYLFSVG